MLGPNDTMREVVIKDGAGRTSGVYGRLADVTNPMHVKALKEQGFTAGGVGGVVKTGGFICHACGRHNYFKNCARCGAV